METRYLWMELLWFAVIIQMAILGEAINVSTDASVQESTENPTASGYAWSSWGSWSACSRSCGGGVAMQERQCLPRTRTAILDVTLPTPVITVRVTRQVQSDCSGVARRYHECNTVPCPGPVKDIRAEQCAAYDRRPFRGRFYTWVPYIDGNSPCMLNCRPLGQQFYASLALVADGTPCTKPGLRAICVQGTCKVVGRESVLAVSDTREVQCGRRKVSGLFTRPRLPLGYSYIATVPRGSCRLNVTEIKPSENYIALKISNGSFIINGEFAISDPGNYEAAGARFTYTRARGRDTIFAFGPIDQSIDIMVLYTQPTPFIKYEYLTDFSTDEYEIESVTRPNFPDALSTAQTKHTRRHHSFDAYPRPTVDLPKYPDLASVSKEANADEDVEENFIGSRKFIWKILSYTQCSRSCGGGIQVGKFRCVEESSNGDREVSPVHCTGSAPAGRRRRCGGVPCPPRWRAAPWSSCPKCGVATRTRIVGCVQDHSRGITKITDQKCPAPKPPTTEPCNIPDCNSNADVYIDSKRMIRPRDHVTDTFHEGPVYTISVNDTDLDMGPEYTFSAAAGWLYTDWSECTGWCVGGGVQTRGVRCTDPSGCAPRKAPEKSKSCTPKTTCDPHDGQWFTGDWSPCSSSCGGKQVRGVLCIGGTGRHLKESACKAPKPEFEKDCGGECQPSWFYSEWSQCKGNCTLGTGVQRRTVWCAKPDSASEEVECGSAKPLAQRACELHCPTVAVSTLPPDLTIESQRVSSYETPSTPRSETTRYPQTQDCEDKLRNCALAVQARLCNYNYYIQKCCVSCRGR